MPALGTDLLRLLKFGENHDIALVCLGGELVKVHRLILAARSAILESMTEVKMGELNSEIFKIDYEPNVVKEFINYLYSDKISADFTDLDELMRIGHQYEVSSLVDMCSKKLFFEDQNDQRSEEDQRQGQQGPQNYFGQQGGCQGGWQGVDVEATSPGEQRRKAMDRQEENREFDLFGQQGEREQLEEQVVVANLALPARWISPLRSINKVDTPSLKTFEEKRNLISASKKAVQPESTSPGKQQEEMVCQEENREFDPLGQQGEGEQLEGQVAVAYLALPPRWISPFRSINKVDTPSLKTFEEKRNLISASKKTIQPSCTQ